MSLHQQVAALMRRVAADIVAPRFCTLAAHEIADKGAGEIVTCADHEAEAALRDGLDRLGADARIVGEEACAADPSLLQDIGAGRVWLIDPLDGTANFAAGRQPFGMMIALVEDGLPLAGWMLDPVSGRMCEAVRGAGATMDGVPVRVRLCDRPRPVAALGTQFMDAARRIAVHAAAEKAFDLESIPRCAAESYPRLVLGRNDIALFQRILPWDHAAGVLFLTEAGGCATHWDGSPYRVGSTSTGVLLAASQGRHTLAAGLLHALLLDHPIASEALAS
ncbi:inositol monophosphatase [Sphingobium lactosutens]|uniref:inositol monophosphatase family protein n=1 Tax=Sphingobium lactosutens TaxID=522773 RepID=UPI0015C098E6|nr:inositol monophosphatase family protein [Sphingobium lactosutens]NWK98177.1 inositol monophosphatase [Sphingobium lactosutens]